MEVEHNQDFSEAEQHYKGYLGYKGTEVSTFLNNMPHKVIGIFSGKCCGRKLVEIYWGIF